MPRYLDNITTHMNFVKLKIRTHIVYENILQQCAPVEVPANACCTRNDCREKSAPGRQQRPLRAHVSVLDLEARET